jgi:hypothetical protein
MGERVVRIAFSDHAAWRCGERHRGHVHLEVIGDEILAALNGGWYSRANGGSLLVSTRSGRTFVVRTFNTSAVVVTAL